MMRRLINFMRGSARLEAEGPFPERLLNLCAQRGVLFWNVEWLSPTRLRLTVVRRDRERAMALGEKALCTVTLAAQVGVPAFLARFRRRYALLVGLTLSLLAVCVLSQFVLTIDVSGNQQVSTAEILTELRRQGLRPGVYGPGLDETTIGHKALIALPELSWLSINLHGTRAEVLVREALPQPEVVDETQVGSVVARASGIITRMEVLSGQAQVATGDTVLEGETLISSTVDLTGPVYSGSELIGQMQVRADGKIYARTWRTLTAWLPLQAQVKCYTGEEQSRWSFTLLGQRIEIYGKSGISFPEYDKISRTWTLTLPGGREMPLAVQREVCRAYTTQTVTINRQAAQDLTKQRLLEALEQALEAGQGQVVSTDFSLREEGELLQVTLQAECTEEIGRFVPESITEENEAVS